MACDYAARAALHERVLANGALFDATGLRAPCASAPTFVAHSESIDVSVPGRDGCVEAAALPAFFSPFTWHIVRQYPNAYELSDRSVFGGATPVRSIRLPSDSGPAVLRARTTRTGRVYFDFARFPIAQISHPTSTLTTVRLLDARFVAMGSGTEDGATSARLSVVVTFDRSGRIVDPRFGN
jgi:hypothetical protein